MVKMKLSIRLFYLLPSYHRQVLRNICLTDDHLYVSLIVVAIPFSSLSSLITGFNKSSTACATSAAAHLTLAKLRCSIFIFSV